MMKKVLRYGIPFVISVGLCYLLFTRIDFKEMVDFIKEGCNFWWIGLALFISIFSYIFRALRWRIQLRAIGVDPPLMALVYSFFGTYAVNLVFPRLGELWRTGYISQQQKTPFAMVFGSMVADRLSDTISVLLITIFAFICARGAILSFLQENPESYNTLVNIVSSPILWCTVAVVVIFVWWFLRRKTENAKINKVKEMLRSLWTGFASIIKMKGKLQWLLLTVLLWGCYFIQMYVAFFAFDFTANVVHTNGLTAVLVCFVLSCIAMGVPANGGIGPWQWAVAFALSGIYGADYLHAVSFANIVLGTQTLFIIVLGLYTFAAIAFSKRNERKVVRE